MNYRLQGKVLLKKNRKENKIKGKRKFEIFNLLSQFPSMPSTTLNDLKKIKKHFQCFWEDRKWCSIYLQRIENVIRFVSILGTGV